ncbi:MAG TPA: granule-associated-like protein [Alcaligenaceae bacterium]|nr:granule-associated-like protein [Alcaligenaceae bacterium]
MLRRTICTTIFLEILVQQHKETHMNKTFKTEDLIAANSAALAHFQSVANTALAAVESLAALNLGFARESLENSSKNTHAALGAKTPQEVAALQAKAIQPAAENLATYTRTVYEISTGAAKEIADLIKGQFDQLNQAAQEAALNAAKASPFGADVALAAVKQAVAAGNTAYENFNKASKQATEMAEANIAKATEAAVRTTKAK